MLKPARSGRSTVVLTSRENFVWHSMQEIIPSLEAAWLGSGHPGLHAVRVFDIDRVPLRDYLPAALEADTVVITCFTVKLALVATLLRREFRIDARYVLHLHSQATFACWPLHEWGLAVELRQSDVFVGSCSRDLELMPLSFEAARTVRVPFTLPELEESTKLQPPLPSREEVPFVYIGRISEQKNLHGLLESLGILARSRPALRFSLTVYGQEDHLGSPNMGIPSSGYLERLLRLSADLGLSARVRFAGHLERTALYRELEGRKHVFVSASLHSDENFGMAAFRSLCLGNSAVLTDWGGHADFAETFGDRLDLVPVLESTAGPVLDPFRLSDALERASVHYPEPASPGLPARYSVAKVQEALLEIAVQPAESPAPLRPTELAMRIWKSRSARLQESTKGCKIFSSYRDPDAAPFFRGYGMRAAGTHDAAWGEEAPYLCPEVRIEDDFIDVDDPRRGEFVLRSQGSPTPEALRVLRERGYAWRSRV